MTHGYDRGGARTSEVASETLTAYDYYAGYYQTTNQVQNASVTYDAHGRLVQWVEAGGGVVTPAAKLQHEYDRVGNIVRTRAEHRAITSTMPPAATRTSGGTGSPGARWAMSATTLS